MARPAAYVRHHDNAIIGVDIDRTFAFDAPGVDDRREAVQTFDVKPSLANGGDVSLEWKLNGEGVLTRTFGTGEARPGRRSSAGTS
jgi:hypothetical protein